MAMEVVVRQIELQEREVMGDLRRRGAHQRHALRETDNRGHRRGMLRAQRREDVLIAAGGVLRGGEQQCPLGSEPLHQRRGGDPGLAGDVRQRQASPARSG